MPEVRRFYWLTNSLLDPQDPKSERPAVVMAVPAATPGMIAVVTRSTTERNGQLHRREPQHGLNKDGWLSRLRVVSTELWTPENVRAIALLLDDDTFSYVLRDFDL
jgi:hypothetical protein